MTRREAVQTLAERLCGLYDSREAMQIARLAVCHAGHCSLTDLVVRGEEAVELPGRIIDELVSGRPVQYVLGQTEFCGLEIGVDERVLIPRPETEELVAHILKSSPRPRRILDVGTGSGCIALALKASLPDAEVVAVDLSACALERARENARALGLAVVFRQDDALAGLPATDGPFDVVVSNPPYIPAAERAAMQRRVTDYEPAQALFVPDRDPLCFYRAIARAGYRLLAPGGALWLEVHSPLAAETRALLQAEGYAEVRCFQDIYDKPRILWSRNPNAPKHPSRP